jgi:LPS-assembly protein
MPRAIGIFLMSATLAAAWPAAAGAQTLTSCKVRSVTPSPQEIPPAPGADPSAPKGYVARADAMFAYVTLICDNAQLFADEVELYPSQNLLKARGHVSFIEGTQRITAERLEFNTKTKLGTFWKAEGIMSITDKPDPRSILGSTEADAYFYGERIEKNGRDKYKLFNGRFTTCVQPTPRWELVASEMVLVKDRHAVMHNAVMKVKDVPVMYLPWMYYPINKGGRATGLLMPSYGNSTLRGQTLSSAFFWAINRSQDATLHYEYSSKAGQGYGAEYRYIQAPGSDGSARMSVFNGKSTDTTSLFTSRTYQLSANMTQRLPARLELRGVVDYSSDIRTQQVTQQSLYAATNSTRSAAAYLRGGYGRVLVDAQAGFTDIFYNVSQGSRIGNAPRVGVTLSQAPIGHSKIYVGATSEFSAMIRQGTIGDPLTSRNLTRVDFNPTIRAPIGSLPFLSLTTSAGYRFTSWSQQLNASGVQVPGALHRSLLDLRADVTGPTFAKIYDTPGSRYATRWKHVVQPTFSIAKTTAFDSFSLVPKNDSLDTLVGGTTNMSYGLSNRLLAKRPTAGGVAVAQEVASIQVQQTYYTSAAAKQYDTSYQSNLFFSDVSKFSPVSVSATVQPTSAANIGMRMEYDMRFRAVRSVSLASGVNAPLFNATAGWSKQDTLSKSATGATVKTAAYQAINTSASLRTFDHRFSGTWSWSYDVTRKTQLQQKFTMAYLSQCCGVAMEYQVFNLGGLLLNGLTQDKRFNLSFSLAGIGTFTNLLGSFGR